MNLVEIVVGVLLKQQHVFIASNTHLWFVKPVLHWLLSKFIRYVCPNRPTRSYLCLKLCLASVFLQLLWH